MTRRRHQRRGHEDGIPVGSVVDGYRVERVVAVREGRYALAQASSSGGDEVLLELAEETAGDKTVRRRAHRLAKVRGSIDHPHLLPLLANGRTGTLRWQSPPARAVTLAERLADGRLEPTLAITLLSQVAGALEAAGRRGLLHRELSPADILVTAEDPPRALVTGFGVDVEDAPGCRHRASVADADYASPEELRGEPPRPESAVYSLACILTACLTGSPPFPYDRPLLAIHAHLVEKPPRISEHNPRLPVELDDILAKALAKDPNRRYRSPVGLMRFAQRALGVEVPIPLHDRGPLHVDSVQSQPRAPVPAPAPPPAPAAPAPPKPAPPAPPEPKATPAPAPEPEAVPAPVRPPAEPKAAPAPAPSPPARGKAAKPSKPKKPAKPARRPAPGRAAKWPAKHRPTGRRGRTRPAAHDEPAPHRVPAPHRGRRREREQGPSIDIPPHAIGAPAGPDAEASHGERRRKRGPRAVLRKAAPGWGAVALLASALAGFAAGSGGADPRSSIATPVIGQIVEDKPQRVEKPSVQPLVKKLARRRAAGRRALGKARRPRDQAEAATRLATAYRDTRVRLRPLPGKSDQERELIRRLRAVESAYGGLAVAARKHRPGAWRSAGNAVSERERDLELLLRAGRWN